MTRASLSVAVLAVLALAFAPAPASAQRLGGVSHAVHGGGGGFRSSGSTHHGSYGGGYGYRGAGPQFTSPWIALQYPYAMGYLGPAVREAAIAPDRRFDEPVVLGIVDASAGYVFDGVVRGQVSGRLRVGHILELEGRYGAYFEQTRDAIQALGLGRLAVLFGLVFTDVVQLRVGVLGMLYHDAVGVEGGFGATLELDVYPVEPLVLRAEAAFGQLGQAGMLDARATLGVQIDRGELYVGYQVFAVDSFVTDPIVLHGPVAGLRVWIS